MLKALIVDDEPLARDELAYLLKRSKEVDIIASVDTIERALEEVHSNTVD
ncbi:DNA-binding response regulator, partial [Pseudomonas sp. FW305-BF6]